MAAQVSGFVAAEVEGNLPEPGRKLSLRLIVLSTGKDPQKCFLSQVFTTMEVPGHPGAKALNGELPSLDQFSKGRR